MIRALLRLLRRGRGARPGYARGGYIDSPIPTHVPAGYIHPGEYIYRAEDGTFWHVQKHPDGDIRTQLDSEEEA